MIFSRIWGFFKQKKLFQQENFQKKAQIKSEWQSFLNKGTYLVYNLKENFLNEINSLYQYPWHYWLDIKLFLQRKKEIPDLLELKNTILSFNDSFVSRRLIEYKSFFDGKKGGIKQPLDINQRIAIIKDDKHNLVIAGAGSGKTSVLTSRIAYLIKEKIVLKKNEFLH